MGIQGLLPLLKDSTRDAHISEFENEFVAIDAYCWLHKGTYSCSVEIAMKKSTTKYVTYCMRYIEMLLHFKVKPILVFDGKRLSSKEETEKKRQEERKNKYNKGIELIRANKITEGRKLLGESVDVTHDMALNLMKECRKKNIDCIVAPYEADAQLAYLARNNIVKCIITEDSDLLVYGCERVMFKMDPSGRGQLTEKNRLYLSLGVNPDMLNEDKFRYMCILSGCDYLPSLPGIGIKFALKFIKMLDDQNIYNALPKLPQNLNKTKVVVNNEYIEGFKIANKTFNHQLVYDPFRRKEVPLQPVDNDDDIVGKKLPENLAFQLAIGNIDPNSMKKLDNFDPDKLGSGFKILWKTDFLPNPAPRPNNLNCSLSEARKRQREGSESETVGPVTSDLKKQCLPQNFFNSKTSNEKRVLTKVSETGFIFEPSISQAKKKGSKTLDRFRLLKTSCSEKKKEEKKQPASDRRKDESQEEYIWRIFDECVSDGEVAGGVEEKDKKVLCENQNSTSHEYSCVACKKSSEYCKCIKEKMSETQRFNECLRKMDHLKNKQNNFNASSSLLDEISRFETEEGRKDKIDPWNKTQESFKKELSPELKINTCSLKREADDTEEPELSLSFEKENKKEEVIVEQEEGKIELLNRSPSPVFRVEKESRILNTNFKYGNILDTTGTSTSIYFSAANSRSFQRSNSLISVERTPLGCNRKISKIKSFGSVPSKTRKSSLRNLSGHPTLYDYGFKKERRDEKESVESEKLHCDPGFRVEQT